MRAGDIRVENPVEGGGMGARMAVVPGVLGARGPAMAPVPLTCLLPPALLDTPELLGVEDDDDEEDDDG